MLWLHRKTPDLDDGAVTECPCDAVATQETLDIDDGVVTESPCDAVSEGREINASTCSVAAESLKRMQSFSEDNINFLVERGSSLFVREPHESFTEGGTIKINDVSAASTVTEFSDGKATLDMKTDYVFALNIFNIYILVRKKKEEVKPWSQGWLIAAGAYPGFCSMKRLEVFLLPLDGMLVHRRSLPRNFARFPQQFAGTHLYTWVERGTVRVKCLAQEHNTMSPARARTRTARSGVERTNHEATAPPTNANITKQRESC